MTEQMAENILRDDVPQDNEVEVALVDPGADEWTQPLMNHVREKHDYYIKLSDEPLLDEAGILVDGTFSIKDLENVIPVKIWKVDFHIYAPHWMAKRIEQMMENEKLQYQIQSAWTELRDIKKLCRGELDDRKE